jgi:hypothetical protein
MKICTVCKSLAREVPGGYVHAGPAIIGTVVREIRETDDNVIPLPRVMPREHPPGPAIKPFRRSRRAAR